MSMGVYIKDMEMPFTCLNCDFHKCAGGVGDFCSLTKRRQFRFKNRPKDCPLVPVPPHGRLGDLDELYAHLTEWYLTHRSGLYPTEAMYIRAMLAGIKDAPTVIEAEEGE
jgi:hypothetical protein